MKIDFRVYFIFLVFFVWGLAVPALFAVGVLSINTLNEVRTYVLDSSPIQLDPTMIIRYDGSVTPMGAIRNAGSVDNASYNSEKALKWPVGGSIVVSIDAVANGNAFDRLSVTPASAFITSSYDVANRKLTISTSYVTTDTTTITDIQATLRTLTFSTKGQCRETRNIRIWILRPGMVFVDSPGIGARVIGMGNYLRAASLADSYINSYTWTTVANNMQYEPPNFGLQPYFISISSAQEDAVVRALHNYGGFASHLGGKYDGTNNTNGYWRWVDGPDVGTAFWQGTGYGPSAASVGLGTTGRGIAVSGVYENWNKGNSGYYFPDNAGGSATSLPEIYLDMIHDNFANTWNDDTNRSLGGYFFKMGGYTSGPRKDKNVIQIQVVGGDTLLMTNPF